MRSIKSRRPYLVEYPRSRTSEAFRAAAEEIAAPWPARTGVAPASVKGPWEVLNVPPGATHHEIVDAYMRLRPILRADSPALISLDCEAARRAALTELEEAFRTLARNLSVPAMPPPRRGSRASLPL